MYIICFDVSCKVISDLKKKIKLNVSSHLIERKIIKKKPFPCLISKMNSYQ